MECDALRIYEPPLLLEANGHELYVSELTERTISLFRTTQRSILGQ